MSVDENFDGYDMTIDEYGTHGTSYDYHLDRNSDIGNNSTEQHVVNYCAKLQMKENFDVHIIFTAGLITATFVMPEENHNGYLKKCGIVKLKYVVHLLSESSMTLTFENCSCQQYVNTSRLQKLTERPPCFHPLIIVKNISNGVVSSNHYVIDRKSSSHGPVINLLLEYLAIQEPVSNKCIGPLKFPQVSKTVKWSYEDECDSFVVTATMNSNIGSMFFKCSKNLCRHYVLPKGASVREELKKAAPDGKNKTELCKHLQLFVLEIGLEKVASDAKNLFNASTKKTSPKTYFNVANGNFEIPSFTLHVILKQNKPGFLFQTAMGFEPHCNNVVGRINDLEMKMILAPYDAFRTSIKNCTGPNFNFQLRPEPLCSTDPHYLRCFCSKKNPWEQDSISTGAVVTVYGSQRAAFCELFERRTICSSLPDQNCRCTLQYNGVPDNIFMLNTQTGVSCTVLDKFLRGDWDISEYCNSLNLDYQCRLPTTSEGFPNELLKLFMSRHTFTKCLFAYILVIGRCDMEIEPLSVNSQSLADILSLVDIDNCIHISAIRTAALPTAVAGTVVGKSAQNTTALPTADTVVGDYLMSNGNAAFRSGNYEAAIKCYTEAIALNASDAVLFSNRSAAFANISLFDAARDDALRAVELQPLWVKPRLNLGAALQGLGKLEGAFHSYHDGLVLEPSNTACKQGAGSIKGTQETNHSGPSQYSPAHAWRLLNFRSPCKECWLNQGQETFSFDGTMTMKLHKLLRFPGAGRSLKNATNRLRLTDRFTRSLFQKLKPEHTTVYHSLLKIGMQLGEAIRKCCSDALINEQFTEFEEKFFASSGVLPTLFLDVVRFAASPGLSNYQKCVLGKFVRECSQHPPVTLFLPIIAVPSLREICYDLLNDDTSLIQGRTLALQAALSVLRDNCTMFADLLGALNSCVPKEVTRLLLYVCERTVSVQAVLSADVQPSFSLQENSYNPVMNMEAWHMIPGPLSGCRLRDVRKLPKIDKDEAVLECNKSYVHAAGSHGTMYGFCNLHGHCNGWRAQTLHFFF